MKKTISIRLSKYDIEKIENLAIEYDLNKTEVIEKSIRTLENITIAKNMKGINEDIIKLIEILLQ